MQYQYKNLLLSCTKKNNIKVYIIFTENKENIHETDRTENKLQIAFN